MKRPSSIRYKSDGFPSSFPYASSQGILLPLLFFLVIPLSAADGDPQDGQYSSGIDPSVGVFIVVLVCAFFTTGCIATYIRGCADAGVFLAPPPYGRFILPVVSGNRRASSGLDRSEIESFPKFVYADVKEMKVGKRALECAVCLAEFDDDDTLRLLPRCEHVFHPECIDSWLAVRSTCPVCRSDLVSVADEIRAGGSELAAPQRRLSGERDGSESSDDEEAPPSVTKPQLTAKFGRCNSTGHSLAIVRSEEERSDRYRLRLPDEMRMKILVEAKMRRAKSFETLPRALSSRKGYRSGEEGSNSRSGKLLRWTGLVKSAGDGEAAAGTSSGAILVAIVVS